MNAALPGVLQVVAHHADQSRREGHGWVPAGVDDSPEVGLAERPQVLDRVVAHVGHVGGQQFGAHAADLGDLGGAVRVAGLAGAERQGESAHPSARRPNLLAAGNVGDLGVLNPADVPEQPRDRVGLRIDSCLELRARQAGDRARRRLPHAPDRIDEDVRARCHLAPSTLIQPSRPVLRTPPRLAPPHLREQHVEDGLEVGGVSRRPHDDHATLDPRDECRRRAFR